MDKMSQFRVRERDGVHVQRPGSDSRQKLVGIVLNKENLLTKMTTQLRLETK